MTSANYDKTFGALKRLYGEHGYALLRELHICVIGLGGVGSWAAESLARTGIGRLTLIDYDTVSLSNINRQLPALTTTAGQKKFAVLKERIAQINPDCQCNCVDDFVIPENLSALLSPDHRFDYVIDACDGIRAKAAIIYYCKRNKIPIITTGGAGGLTDPTYIQVADLSRTYNDPLAAKVRSMLREQYNFTKNRQRSFSVECVFSSQQPVYPQPDGTVSHQKPGVHGVSLDCRLGYGSVSFVTANFGFVAASRAVNKLLHKRAATPANKPPRGRR